MTVSRLIKRLIDVIGALLLLVLTSPIVALAAIAVRCDSPGPAIFRQTRVGLHGKRFMMYKLRTMRMGAESEWVAPPADQFSAYIFQDPGDARVTPVGRFLRRTSIDELPQLVNVLKGEMSLVGPRPEIPEMVALYQPEMHRRHDVLPGITGLAQVSGRGSLTCGEMMAYDLTYRDNWSLKLDGWILLETLRQFIRGV